MWVSVPCHVLALRMIVNREIPKGRRIILAVKYLNVTEKSNILFDQQTVSSYFHL